VAAAGGETPTASVSPPAIVTNRKYPTGLTKREGGSLYNWKPSPPRRNPGYATAVSHSFTNAFKLLLYHYWGVLAAY